MSDAANFFDQIAAQQIPAPVRRKMDRAEKRDQAKQEAEREQKDQDTLAKFYRQWRRDQREALIAGPFGRDIRGLLQFLDTMTLSSAPALLGLVERARWIQRMPTSDRADLLSLIADRIARCREKAGLPPFDDEIPWCEPAKAFTTIKTQLGLDGR